MFTKNIQRKYLQLRKNVILWIYNTACLSKGIHTLLKFTC